jgi:uncharacterized protein YjiS (DUF1127 family)
VSAFAGSRRPGIQSYFAALGEWVAQLGARAARASAGRKTLHELARLDDRALKDIGLFRSDVEAAECLPLGSDRVALLRSRRAARCRGRFADRYY